MSAPLMSKQVPQVLFTLAVVVLAAGLVWHVVGARWMAGGFTLAYLAWMLAEARVTFSRGGGSAPDPTVAPYGLARLAVITAAVFGPAPWTGWAWWMALPAVVFLGGMALRLWAIQVLGRFYSHLVVRQAEHGVVTTGPYAWVRHPAYTGMVVANAGFVVFFAGVLSVTAFALLVAAIAWRIKAEEAMLDMVPGYSQYSAGKPRLIPAVW
ncbi:methyltransferase family protein [Actinokineospora sp. 24-640]